MIGQGQVLDGTRVTVPAGVVDWLRRAAYAEIGSAAEALDAAAFASDREAHQEWFCAPAASLRESYGLLDAVGWSRTVPPVAVQVDLGRDSWGLMRALAGALEFADEDVSELARSEVEHAESDLTPEHDAEVERVGVLWEFTARAQARIDALAVGEGACDDLALAA